jgi:hypothetical protein
MVLFLRIEEERRGPSHKDRSSLAGPLRPEVCFGTQDYAHRAIAATGTAASPSQVVLDQADRQVGITAGVGSTAKSHETRVAQKKAGEIH